MMTWLSWLRSDTPILRPIENVVLSALADQLPPASRNRFLEQVAEVNRVYRFTDDREVNLYRMRNGRPAFREDLRMEVPADEVCFATVWLNVAHDQLKAEVWLVHGQVFSLNFNKSPTQWAYARASVQQVRLWTSDTEVKEAAALGDLSTIAQQIRDWLGPELGSYPISSVLPPLRDEALVKHLEHWDTPFPTDVIALFSVTGGFRIGSIEVHGPTSLASVIVSGGEFIVLADAPETAVIGLKSGEKEATLYYLEHDQAIPQRMPTDLRRSLIYLAGKADET